MKFAFLYLQVATIAAVLAQSLAPLQVPALTVMAQGKFEYPRGFSRYSKPALVAAAEEKL